MTTTESPSDRSYAEPRRPRWVALMAVAVAVVVAVIITTVVVIGNHGSATAAPFSQVQASCGDWMDSASADAGSDARWCTDMFAWMGDRTDGSMMGSMMWSGSAELGRACRGWVTDERAETGSRGPQRCRAMLAWMNGHMSSQGGRWMMPSR